MLRYTPLPMRLVSVRDELREKKPRDIDGILEIVRRHFTLKDKDFKRFSHYSGKWYGIITRKRNDYFGTIFSMYGDTPVVIRGYPKIRYAEESLVLNKECVVEYKLDGTNLACYSLPDGTFMCKTRQVERGDRQGYMGRNWMELLRKTESYSAVERCCRDENVIIFGELYGYLNQGEFVKYDIPIDYKVFDIVRRDTLTFLPREEIEDLASVYGFKTVEVYWRGVLTLEAVEWLERDVLESMHTVDGFVAKTSIEVGELVIGTVATDRGYHLPVSIPLTDRFFCKLKTEKVKLKCYEISRATIPTPLIREAVRKAKENLPIGASQDDLFSMTVEELREEATQELIKRSKEKIWRIIYSEMTYSGIEYDIYEYLNELSTQGIDMTDKGTVMRSVAKRFIGVNPSLAFRVYRKWLKERGMDV